ncbi:alcohol dehydrogenase IV [Mycena filopes]|nr:alcohol dehydrogenase IV [Mycena filopes]
MSGSYAWIDAIKSIHYGPNCVSTVLPELIQALHVKRGLIVTGNSLYTKTDVVSKVKEILQAQDAYAGVFTEFGEHTPVAGINTCVKVYLDTGADFIIALGGGSPIDGAKAVRYRISEQTGEAPPVQIAIPTTLSAAEFSIGAGYTDENGNKVAVSNPLLAPAAIILDAELTLPTPSRLWLSTGIRAVDHAVENMYRPGVSHPVKILCYAALADLFKYLPVCKEDPNDIEARQRLLNAAWMSVWPTKAGKYSSQGMMSHALGHRLGAKYAIPHGITSCLTLSPVVAIQSRIASKEDQEYLANSLFYLREASTGSIEGDILKLSKLIDGLVVQLELKSTLSEYKVPREDFSALAEGNGDLVELLKGIY